MAKRIGLGLGVLVAIGLAYLLFWPVPIDPKAWQAPDNPGFAGPFEENSLLGTMKRVPLEGRRGPEDAVMGPGGDVFISTEGGEILRLDAQTAAITAFADTGGRPLGLAFAPDGTLVVADAYRGLLAVDGAGEVTVLADRDGEGRPIGYADDVAVAGDGTVYFTDASSRFGAEANGGTLPAAVLDLMEHGGHGRLLKYDPATRAVGTVLDGLQFANGVALRRDGRALLVVETGSYRVLKVWLAGERAGQADVLVDNLPGFPDNVDRASDGTFWLGLASPRSAVLDRLSGRPFARKVVQRLPPAMRPKARRYGFLLHFDQDGNILETLQDPSGGYAHVTGAAQGPEDLLIVTSLTEDSIGILPR